MCSGYIHFQLIIGLIFCSIIACSPAKFNKNQQISSICDSSVVSCISKNGFIDVQQNYKIGSGKVDILFVTDNSASMSKNQVHMAAKFAGFIQNLDSKSIDYRIAITTTDLIAVAQNKLITFANGAKFITKTDADRVTLFSNAIVRNETIACENFIIAMFNTYRTSFKDNAYYITQYPLRCPSYDTRGIYTANLVVSENSSSLMRSDANLNIILISNDNVRKGNVMQPNDSALDFTKMMQQKYPEKYWDFNSIIVKDSTCQQSQTLYNADNELVISGNLPAIGGNIGLEYAKLSSSPAKDIDDNPRPRGQILDICESNYAQHFNTMSTQISQDARIFTMRCTPSVAPVVFTTENSSINILHTWNSDKIIFPKGTEGMSVTISYKCYTGPT